MRLKWDQTSERLYETGVKNGVLYPTNDDGTYGAGVAWNGLTSVSETPSGAESNPIYADDMKYLDIRSAEQFGATVQAYTYPKEFALCDGSEFLNDLDFLTIGQQSRKTFGLSYRTIVGNDVKLNDYSYKLHLVYGATASPSEREYQTVNDSPEAISFSWEMTTTPIEVEGYKPTSLLTVDVSKIMMIKDETIRNGRLAQVKILEDKLYGSDDTTYSAVTNPVVEDIGTYYEKDGDTYVKTTDTEIDPSKTYYVEDATSVPTLVLPAEFKNIFGTIIGG